MRDSLVSGLCNSTMMQNSLELWPILCEHFAFIQVMSCTCTEKKHLHAIQRRSAKIATFSNQNIMLRMEQFTWPVINEMSTMYYLSHVRSKDLVIIWYYI